MISILIVDDHQLIREGLRQILEWNADLRVVAEAADGEAAVAMALLHQPDVVLMDINLPGINGLEAAARIEAKLPQTRIIALTIHRDEEYVAELVKVGIAGYVLKDVGADQLVAAIRRVAAGGSYLDPQITPLVLNQMHRMSQPNPASRLSMREMEVLALVARGNSNKEIAGILYISEKTVKNHLTSIFRKLEVEGRTQAALYAVKHKLVGL